MATRPRSRRSPREDLRLLAEYHVSGIRYSRKGREIVAVKHIAFGWISPRAYYALQELHAAMPTILEGGYRLKQAIWSWEIDVEVLATGVKLPAGLAIVAGTLGLAALDAAAGNQLEAALDVAALFLPFGELWLLYRGILAVEAIGGAANAAAGLPATSDQFAITPPAGKTHYVGIWPFGHWE